MITIMRRAATQVLLVLLFLAASIVVSFSKERDVVYNVVPSDQKQVDYLDGLLKNDPSLDFWVFPVSPGKDVTIHIKEGQKKAFEQMMDAHDLRHFIAINDLEPLLEQEKMHSRAGGFDASYHSLSEIHQEIKNLQSAHSDVAQIINLGKSHEQRDMLAIQIKQPGSGKKELFFFNCGIHAREWISPATCMYMIRKILETRHSNADVQYMLSRFEWVILPVLNVDGFQYTHTNNRMWRKTRKPYAGGYGADPNRNFNYRWAGVGTSSSQGSDIFTGSHGFSEVETYNVGRYLFGRRKELKGYIDFHAYSQLWMSPWGYTNRYPPQYDKQEKAMKAAVNALTAVHGTRYKYGPAAITIYPTTGDTTDWTFGVLGVVHSYCVELRPQSHNPGFILPPDQIIPVGQETLAGLKALTRNMT